MRRRLLQAGFLLAAVAAVVVADLTADELSVLQPAGPAPAFVAVAGRVLGGFAVGMAFRLQMARSTKPDPRFRLWVSVPCAALAVTPALMAVWTGPWDTLGQTLVTLQRLAPFAGAVLGLSFALSVRSTRRSS